MNELLDELLNYGSIAIKKHKTGYIVMRLNQETITAEYICHGYNLADVLKRSKEILKLSIENPKLFMKLQIDIELHCMQLEGENR